MRIRVKAIVNPAAGSGSSLHRWPEVKEMVSRITHDVSFTNSPGHATSLAAEAVSEGFDGIIIAGGDGTINEVLQAVAESDVIIAPISAGTGSDFMRSLGMPDVKKILDSLTSGICTRIDTGLIETGAWQRRFLNIMEAGFGAEVMSYVNSHRRSRRSFNTGVLRSLWKLKSYEITMKYETEVQSLESVEIVVANGRYFGGGMLASPDSSLTDGLLDIHIVGGMGRMELISKLGKLRNGTYISDTKVRTFHLSEFSLEGMAPVEADGENMGFLPVRVRSVPHSLSIAGKIPEITG
ncbi:MAG: diacylglycerol kinase family lipid kinase [Thermoplasmataceae archaeon]